jgi:succinate dehydrogenase flavin-adding protein (antitoxin of CptAB toxin-antitoxin module)
MRELDAVLHAFLDANTLTDDEVGQFEAILELPDPTLHAYLLGRSAPTDEPTLTLIERIRASVGPAA